MSAHGFNGPLTPKLFGDEDIGFKKIIVRYKKIGYNIDVLRQTACLVVNPIKVNSLAYLIQSEARPTVVQLVIARR